MTTSLAPCARHQTYGSCGICLMQDQRADLLGIPRQRTPEHGGGGESPPTPTVAPAHNRT